MQELWEAIRQVQGPGDWQTQKVITGGDGIENNRGTREHHRWTSWTFDPAGIMASIIRPQWGNEFGGTHASLVRDMGIGSRAIFKKLNGDTIPEQ
jgi:hypothetical protein